MHRGPMTPVPAFITRKNSLNLAVKDPGKLSFVRVMDVLRCFSGFHSNLFKHRAAFLPII